MTVVTSADRVGPGGQGAGRFAPSPSGDLHVGNLRTALLAWLFARSSGRSFLIRLEDLDRVRSGSADRQLADLRALGLDWDGPVVRQSDRGSLYRPAIDRLTRLGLTYECFCTRREILEAASAPHGDPLPDGAYPGTCRDLTEAERAARRTNRPAARRLRAGVSRWTVQDRLIGPYTGVVDDLVLCRGDGVVAYNLAVVVDDTDQGIDQVVRGHDLLSSSPRQAYLAHLLGLPAPEYAHVPLALNPVGRRLAKRDGAVTLGQLRTAGRTPADVLGSLACSLGMSGPGEPVSCAELLQRFAPDRLPRRPWTVHPAEL